MTFWIVAAVVVAILFVFINHADSPPRTSHDQGDSFDPYIQDSETRVMIMQAIRDKHLLHIHYARPDWLYDHTRIVYSERLIRPIELFEQQGEMYLRAYCHLREEVRVFKISRIQKIRMIQ